MRRGLWGSPGETRFPSGPWVLRSVRCRPFSTSGGSSAGAGPGPGPVWALCPSRAPPHHACPRYFNHRHVVCLRRRGLFTATRATRLHPAAEPSQRPALARPGRSGLVHLLLRIFHLISPGREPRRRARRPRGPRAHRSVTAQDPPGRGTPVPTETPPLLCFRENHVLFPSSWEPRSAAAVVWQPQTLWPVGLL